MIVNDNIRRLIGNFRKLSKKTPSGKAPITKLLPDEPKDAYWIVYIVFFLFGLIRLLPSSFFITANEYWMYKFRNVSLNDTAPEDRTVLQTEFSADASIALRIPTIVFQLLTLFFGYKIPLNVRLLGSLVSILLLFILLSAGIFIDTDSWQYTFYIISMILIALTNAFDAVLDITFCAVLAKFPVRYLGMNINGAGAAGVCSAILQILSLSSGLSPLPNAGIYFSLGIGIVLLTLILTILSMKTSEFYKFFMENCNDKPIEESFSWQDTKEILKQSWIGIIVLTFFMITISSMAGIEPLVVSESYGTSVWGKVYFVPVITFLLTAVCDTIGRDLASRIPYTINEKLLCILSIIKTFIFVPLVMLCNAQPRKHLPVIFPYDYQYILIQILCKLTNGYMVATVRLNIRKNIAPDKCNKGLQIFSVTMGVLCVAFSFLNIVAVRLL